MQNTEERKGGAIVQNREGTKRGKLYFKDKQPDGKSYLVHWDDGSKEIKMSKNLYYVGYFE